MKKYVVCVDYVASVHIEVEAQDVSEAEAKALSKARQTVPYDDLAITVGYVDEMGN